MKHKHAELMALYAQDAAETETPWKSWECQFPGERSWQQLYGNPNWAIGCDYRRKPRTIHINGYEVPEPCRSPLQDGAIYFVARLSGNPTRWTWDSGGADKEWLKKGIVHLTREAAELHAKALLSFTRKEGK